MTDKEKYQGLFSPEVGEQELCDLCTKFKLSYSDTKQGFPDFKDSRGNIVSSQFRPLLQAVNTIPVSTAACERGFSVMNDVCTPLRSLVTVPHLSALMFIKIVGPPLTSWNPLPYVKASLAKDRRDATSLHGMARAMDVPQPGSMMESEWNIL